MLTTPIRRRDDITRMKDYYLDAGKYRDYLLFIMGINTALRISDLISLKWGQVFCFQTNAWMSHINIVETKTGKRNCFILNKSCVEALELLRANTKRGICPEDYIFYSRNRRLNHISRNRAWHIIKEASQRLNIDGNISCHSLRKTFGYHAWKIGTPPAVIMGIYNHSSISVTKRYLSITQDDYDEVFMSVNL